MYERQSKNKLTLPATILLVTVLAVASWAAVIAAVCGLTRLFGVVLARVQGG